jgi:hypothetical protein
VRGVAWKQRKTLGCLAFQQMLESGLLKTSQKQYGLTQLLDVCVHEGLHKGLNETKSGISISQSRSRVSSHDIFNWSLSASSLVFGSSFLVG